MDISVQGIFGDVLSKIQSSLPFNTNLAGLNPAHQKAAQETRSITFEEALETATEAINAEELAEEPAETADYAALETAYVDGAAISGSQGITNEVYDAILAAAAKYGVDANLVKAVIKQESDYNRYDVSTSGAMGLMQIMPFNLEDLGITNPYDVNQNIDGGVNYLKQMLNTFGDDVELALAGYNAGPNAVKRWGGIPPYAETEAYVPKVLGYQADYAEKMRASK